MVDANADGKVDNIDTLIEQARWELDAKKQETLWKEAQVQLLKDVAVGAADSAEIYLPP